MLIASWNVKLPESNPELWKGEGALVQIMQGTNYRIWIDVDDLCVFRVRVKSFIIHMEEQP
jgi:hypothetical protein